MDAISFRNPATLLLIIPRFILLLSLAFQLGFIDYLFVVISDNYFWLFLVFADLLVLGMLITFLPFSIREKFQTREIPTMQNLCITKKIQHRSFFQFSTLHFECELLREVCLFAESKSLKNYWWKSPEYVWKRRESVLIMAVCRKIYLIVSNYKGPKLLKNLVFLRKNVLENLDSFANSLLNPFK